MSEISLAHTSGGLLGDVVVDALRQPDVEGDARFLADIATFVDSGGNAPSKAQYEGDLEAAFRTGQATWSAYADELARGMEVSRLRERLLHPLLTLLGFAPVYQRAYLQAGGHAWAISHLGWTGDHAPPIHMVANHDLDDRAGAKRSPHEELQGFLNASPLRWGIVTNGWVLRLLRDYHHTRSRGFVEFDLSAIFEAASEPDFLPLWRLCHASRFRPLAETEGTGEPLTRLEQLYDKALTAGVAAGKRLQPQVHQAIEALANGLLDSNPDLRATLHEQQQLGRDFYRELLTVLYRMLFLLFAEQRGMLRDAGPLYDETYSLTRLRARAEANDAEPRRRDLWEGLKTTFRIFGDETLANAVGVYPYNGQLFDLTRTPLTTGGMCSNKAVLDAIRSLTTVQAGKVRMYVDYRNLGVEELGTVYESLLDYTLTIADAPVQVHNRLLHAGQAYLAPLSIERSDLASYYTPRDLVDLLLTRSLDPMVEERLGAAATPEAQEEALLGLRVIDPACGSAAILVGALDRIAYALAHARSTPLEPRDTELAQARRDVLQRCIYGVDKDPFAVELAKVALWIHCVVPDQPLSFLDAHIVCGDALVGWPLLSVAKDIPTAAFDVTGVSDVDRTMLSVARARNEAFVSEASLFSLLAADPDLSIPEELSGGEESFADIRRKTEVFSAWRNSPDFHRWETAANLWTAAFFWTAAHGDVPTTKDYQAALDDRADPDFAKHAEEITRDLNPLHWPLAFPDVRAAGGFDLVLGNPPWEESASIEQEFFAQAAPHIALMTSEHRGDAIKTLAMTDPDLYDRWARYKATQERFAHYAKTCGRYTRTGAKTNTYVLFTESAAENATNVGLIVKSGIATDLAQSPVWKSLLAKHRVREVTDIVNSTIGGALVFPAVAAVERFSVLVLRDTDPTAVLQASMLNFGVEDAATAPYRAWSREDLVSVSPRTHSILSTNSQREIDLALELHSRFATLDFNESNGSNPWALSYTTLFNSTYAKRDGLLLRPDALAADGFTMQPDRTFRHPDGRVAVPVYEGQMANRWDHRARTFEGYKGTKKYGKKPDIPWVTDDQHADTALEVEPRYWMLEEVAEARVTAVAGDGVVLATRDIGAVWTNRRSVRVALLGRAPTTHTLPVLVTTRAYALPVAALLNSMTFDFLARIHMPGGHVTPWILSQCAAPSPDALPREVTTLSEEMSITSLRLATATKFKAHQWDPVRRVSLDARLDALVASAYGLTLREYESVLDHFTLLKRIEEGDDTIREYRSKRLRMESFEAILGGR